MINANRITWLILALTVIGLVIAEIHFWIGSIDAAQYIELVCFFYGGGVAGKVLPLLLTLWTERGKA